MISTSLLSGPRAGFAGRRARCALPLPSPLPSLATGGSGRLAGAAGRAGFATGSAVVDLPAGSGAAALLAVAAGAATLAGLVAAGSGSVVLVGFAAVSDGAATPSAGAGDEAAPGGATTPSVGAGADGDGAAAASGVAVADGGDLASDGGAVVSCGAATVSAAAGFAASDGLATGAALPPLERCAIPTPRNPMTPASATPRPMMSQRRPARRGGA